MNAKDDAKPRDPRYFVCADREVAMTIEREHGLTQISYDAQLLDVSQTGIRFNAETHADSGEEVAVRIAISEVDFEYLGVGVVRWLRPGKDEQWQIGCSLNPKISLEELESLCQKRIVERRDDPRIAADVQLSALWETELQPQPARMVNYSRGGLCLLTTESKEVGYRVRISKDHEDEPLTARTIWTRRVEEGFLIGCETIGGDPSLLRKWSESQAPEPVAVEPAPSKNRHLFEWAALIALAVSGLIVFLLPR